MATLKDLLVCLFLVLVQGVETGTRKSRECTPSVTVQKVTPSRDIFHFSKSYGTVPDLETCTKHCCFSTKDCDMALFDGKYCFGIKCNSQHVCILKPSKPGQRSYNAAFIDQLSSYHENGQDERSSKRSNIPKTLSNEKESIIKALEEMSEGRDEKKVVRVASNFPNQVAMAAEKFSATSKLQQSGISPEGKVFSKRQSKTEGNYRDKTKVYKKTSNVFKDGSISTYKIETKRSQNHVKTVKISKTRQKAILKEAKSNIKSKLQTNSKRSINLGTQSKKVNDKEKHLLKQKSINLKITETPKEEQTKSRSSNKPLTDSLLTKQEEECYATKVVKDSALRAGMNAGKFTIHKTTNNITECVEYCCNIERCDVAVIMAGTCYSVQCKSERDCKSKVIGGESSPFNPVLAYVHNGLNQDVLGHHFVEINPPEDNLIIRKTVVPNPSQGDVGTLLDSLQFQNGPSVVSSSLEFGYFQQCFQYMEPENVTLPAFSWTTIRHTPYSYLYQLPSGTAPPLGLRSAVPLGGMGTGSFEIRADGTFSEWTIENQSPGGSAKLSRGALDLAVFGVRVKSPQGSKSALLRTHPPKGFPGVQALGYSGAYPVSKLNLFDERFYGISIDLYAFGTLHTRKTAASFVPAVTFTLNIQNPTNTDVNVSFMLNLPLGMQPDTSRYGGDSEKIFDVSSSSGCAELCVARGSCLAWEHNDTTCLLKDSMPLHAYRAGVSSGVKGEWTKEEHSLTLTRPGMFPNSGMITVLSANTNMPSFAINDDFTEIWESFESHGYLKPTKRRTGFNGAIAVTARLPAGEAETLTLIMAWHYPNRDHAGQIVGNYYSELFKSSKEVAEYARNDIQKNLQDIAAFHSNIMSPKSLLTDSQKPYSLPTWLQDHLVNSLSFWRSGFRVADGRWRQWEAYDCNDLDSVHNDFQREIPYILFFPDLLENVVRAWAKYQQQDGLIMETLGPGCSGWTIQMDLAGGRVHMADVNAAFITQVYHLYLWTANKNLLEELWPSVRNATVWLIENSTNGTALPQHMTNTYDILNLEVYDHSMYNSVMYLLSMRVAEKLAKIKEDEEMKNKTRKAFNKGRQKIEEEMWDEKKGFYHAWWDKEKGSPDWLMADSLYGQVWAYTLGLGSLLDPDKMRAHLKKEMELNDTPYGLRVMTTGVKRRKKSKHYQAAKRKHHQAAKRKNHQAAKRKNHQEANASINRSKRGEDPFAELKNFFTGEGALGKNESKPTATLKDSNAEIFDNSVVSGGAKHSEVFAVNSNTGNATDNVVNRTVMAVAKNWVHKTNKTNLETKIKNKTKIKNVWRQSAEEENVSRKTNASFTMVAEKERKYPGKKNLRKPVNKITKLKQEKKKVTNPADNEDKNSLNNESIPRKTNASFTTVAEKERKYPEKKNLTKPVNEITKLKQEEKKVTNPADNEDKNSLNNGSILRKTNASFTTVAEKERKYPEKKNLTKPVNEITKLKQEEKKVTNPEDNKDKNSLNNESYHNNVSQVFGSSFGAVKNTSNQKHSESRAYNKPSARNASTITEVTERIQLPIISDKSLNFKPKNKEKTRNRGITQDQLRHHNCTSLQLIAKHRSIWMGSNPDWSSLQVHLGMDPKEALTAAQKSLEHYRVELNDLWNIHGLTAGKGYGLNGQPWCTSHYTFHLVLWHIPFAISGQQYSAVEQTLEFKPRVKVPYILPFFVPSASGTIESKRTRGQVIEYALTVTSGLLKLKSVSIDGKPYGTDIVVIEGDFIKWKA